MVYIGGNLISNLELLENAKFENLELLNLKKIMKPNTDYLNSEQADINIKILKNVKFKKLKLLNISINNILDIQSLEDINLKNLKELYLKEWDYQI